MIRGEECTRGAGSDCRVTPAGAGTGCSTIFVTSRVAACFTSEARDSKVFTEGGGGGAAPICISVREELLIGVQKGLHVASEGEFYGDSCEVFFLPSGLVDSVAWSIHSSLQLAIRLGRPAEKQLVPKPSASNKPKNILFINNISLSCRLVH